MKYLMLVMLLCTAFFVTACDERPHIDVNGPLGAGGLFSQDSEGNGRNGHPKKVEMCEYVAEQRCFETCYSWVKIDGHWRLREVISQAQLCEIKTLLTSTEQEWRIQCYIPPESYNPECLPWFIVVIDGFYIDIRENLVFERIELRPCNIEEHQPE